jgi:hypothetical protein
MEYDTYGLIRADISTCRVRGSRLDISTRTLNDGCPSGADALIIASRVFYESGGASELGTIKKHPRTDVTWGNFNK